MRISRPLPGDDHRALAGDRFRAYAFGALLTCPKCRKPLIRGTCLTCGTPSEPPTASFEDEASYREWSDAEEAFLLATMHTLTCDAQTEALAAMCPPGEKPRTPKAVKQWYSRKRVRKPRARAEKQAAGAGVATGAVPGRRWTPEEDALLEDGELGILAHLRSPDAIVRRASRLGAPLRSGDGAMSVRQAAQASNVHHSALLRWIGRGLLPAHRNGDLWRIDPLDVELIIPTLKRAGPVKRCAAKSWAEA